MQRDLDLVRTILLQVEAIQPGTYQRLSIDGVSDDVVSRHVELLHEAGFVKAIFTNDAQGFAWQPERLTWNGHDYLDAVRNDQVWDQTKSKLAAVGGAVGLEVVKAVAGAVARSLLGLS